MNRRPEVLVVGSNSGAMHGSLVMTRYLVRALSRNGCRVTVLDKAFSRRNTEIGRIRPHKFIKVSLLLVKAAFLILTERYDAAFYLPASLPPALTFDYFFFRFIKCLSRNWVGYSHMVRYKQLKEGSSRFHSVRTQSLWQSFDWCIGPSTVVSSDLESVGVPPGRIRVLLNCLPPGWTFADPEAVAARAETPPSSILFLSTVRARKGVWDLLEAFRILVLRGTVVPGVEIIGPETDAGIFDEIAAWAASNGLRDRVRIIGEMDHQSIEAFLARESPIMVFPTRREEAFGLVLAEAMSKGVPVIATRIGAIPEVLQDGSAGLLVEPGDPSGLADAVAGILGNPGLRTSIAAAGLEASRKYSFDSYAESLHGILEWIGILN